MLFKCKMCGGNLEVKEDSTTCRCSYCGTSQTVSSFDCKNHGSDEINVETSIPVDTAQAMVQRGNLALEDGAFDAACNFFERALDSNPSCARAYLGKFLVGRKISSLDALRSEIVDFDGDRNFQRAIRFADFELADELKEVLATNDKNIESRRKTETEINARIEEKQKKEGLKKLALRRAERKYNDECASIEGKIQAEMKPLKEEIVSRYEPKIKAIKQEMGNARLTSMREKVALQMKLSRLKAKKAAPNLFNSAQITQANDEIEQITKQLDEISKQEQANESYEVRIAKLTSQQDAEISAAEEKVRAKYQLPDKDAFINEALKRHQ